MTVRRALALVTMLVAPILVVIPAGAQMPAPELRMARAALATYDLDGERTLDVVRRLGEFARRGRRSGDIREALYLRSVVSVDLLLLASTQGNATLPSRVADAYGVSRERLIPRLEQDMARVSVGAYAEAVEDARGALRAVRGRGAVRGGVGIRSDALFVSHVRQALAASPDALSVLADMTEDPCTETCPPFLSHLDEQGRRALTSLRAVGQALSRLAAASGGGDPFARAIVESVRADQEALGRVVLRPTTIVGPHMALVAAPDGAAAGQQDLFVAVAPGEIRYGWAAQFRLGNDGDVESFSVAEPMLPETMALELPVDFRPVLRPVDEVTELFRHLLDGREQASVAIGASTTLPSHVLARILLSAERAGVREPMLLGRAADGSPRAIALRVISARHRADHPQSQVRVRVRLGGYSLVTPLRGEEDIPRVPNDGRSAMRFDTETLAQRAARAEHRSASVSFMSAVRSGPVMHAAFTVAPQGRPVTLVLP